MCVRKRKKGLNQKKKFLYEFTFLYVVYTILRSNKRNKYPNNFRWEKKTFVGCCCSVLLSLLLLLSLSDCRSEIDYFFTIRRLCCLSAYHRWSNQDGNKILFKCPWSSFFFSFVCLFFNHCTANKKIMVIVFFPSQNAFSTFTRRCINNIVRLKKKHHQQQ